MNSTDLNQNIARQLHALRHSSLTPSKERDWILDQLQDEGLTQEVMKLSVTALHILSALETDDKTGIELANQLEVTRGGVSRAVQNLLKYQFLTSHQGIQDKKKIYFHLTDKGRKVALTHDKMHKLIEEKFNILLSSYTISEKEQMLKFLTDFNRVEAQIFEQNKKTN